MMDNDFAEYRRTASERAFRELVKRYINLVYSTALRLVNGDTHSAEDVSQTVFVDLARKARTLPEDVRLSGWLHRDTCFVAANRIRGERRRQNREREAVEMTLQNTQADFSHVAPILDQAINELGEEDRTAILLRFFEQHDFRTVGQILGNSEDAARMRVNRALEKLEIMLKRRGVTAGSVTLGVVLSANAVQAAPVGLALTISTAAAITATSVTAAAATATVTKTIAMTTLQKTIIGVTLAAAVGTGIYEATRASRWEKQVQLLQNRRIVSGENDLLSQELENSKTHLATLVQANETLRAQVSGILKLRGEVAQLRSRSLELTKSTIQDDATEMALKSWLNKVKTLKQRFDQWPGINTPETALLTEEDWLKAARGPMDSEEDWRKTMSGLRQIAKGTFAGLVDKALDQHAKFNNGQFPSDLSQLAPYLDPPANSFLDGYEITKPGAVTVEGKPKPWAMTSKGAIAHDRTQLSDKDYDLFVVIYPGGFHWF